MTNFKRNIIIASVALTVVGATTGVLVFRHFHQYDNVVYTNSFSANDLHKAYTLDEEKYKQSKALIDSVALKKFYTGNTVYFTKDDKPFIICGDEAVYLQETDNGITINEKDKDNIRLEKTGQKTQICNKAQFEKINTETEKEKEIESQKNKNTYLSVNKLAIKEIPTPEKDDKGQVYYDISSLMGSIGVSYKSAEAYIDFSFTNPQGENKNIRVDVAGLSNQPWVDKASGNVYPAIRIINNKYYIAEIIVAHCFGFDVEYNTDKNYVAVTTLSEDNILPVAKADYSVDSKYIVGEDIVSSLGLLSEDGVLKDDAAKIYDKYMSDKKQEADKKAAEEAAKKAEQQRAAAKAAAEAEARRRAQMGFKGAAFANCSQVVVVTASNMYTRSAVTSVYEKKSSGWKKVISGIDTLLGQNGLCYASERKQFTNTTPAGLFNFKFVFGNQPNPGTKMQYRRISDNSYWDENSGSPTYNRWVEKDPGGENEHLIAEPFYKYSVVIDYNWNQVPNKGAGIFLHVKPPLYTGGCVGIDEAPLLQIIRWLDPAKNPKILIIPKKDFDNYYY